MRLLILVVLYALCCVSTGAAQASACPNAARTEYDQENTNEFVNPDRGWYFFLQTAATNYLPLDFGGITALRSNENYSLIVRHIVLDSFTNQSIDPQTLSKISDDLVTIRNAYFKIILKFSYTVTLTVPRGDAPKSVILEHIAQLSPVLNANSDVILAIQHGFIGTGGDGYYTDHFGDMGVISPLQQQDRQEVYDALLANFPACTMIQVRTWPFKEQLTGTSDPVTSEEAYNCGSNSTNSRTGIHDDCFLASETDFGTWVDSAVDKPRMSEHSLYTVFGGQTCNPASARNACPTALEELELFHFTYLNNGYHPDVLQRWRDEGCYDTIEKRLGYRLVLASACFPDSTIQSGYDMTFNLTVLNNGFAAPVSQRELKLIFVQEDKSVTLPVSGSNVNPQFWLGNGTEHTVNGQVSLPCDMDTGNWSVFLAITESTSTLRETYQYNILFVNQPSAAQETGWNDLQTTVSITQYESPDPVEYDITTLPQGQGQCLSAGQKEAALANIERDVRSLLKQYKSCNNN